jgi:hypothetical protein
LRFPGAIAPPEPVPLKRDKYSNPCTIARKNSQPSARIGATAADHCGSAKLAGFMFVLSRGTCGRQLVQAKSQKVKAVGLFDLRPAPGLDAVAASQG